MPVPGLTPIPPALGRKETTPLLFQAQDPGGLTSTASIAVTITPVNHAPVAQTGALTTKQGAAASGTLTATDPDGDTLTYSVVSQGAKGTATITNANTGAYSYSPSSGAKGTDFFTFQAKDPGGLTSTASVSVTITPVNHAPVAQTGALTTKQGAAASGTLTATDPDGDTLTYSVVSQGAKGTATITNANTGAYSYSPSSGAKGSDAFTFQAKDPGGLTSTASVSVTITPVNHAPVAKAGALTTKQGAAASGTLAATDPDGDTLTYSIVSQGSKGTVTITNANTGAYTYTPKSSVQGTDFFTFKAKDPGGLTSTAFVAVTITVNRAPVASTGTLATNPSTAATSKLVAADADVIA